MMPGRTDRCVASMTSAADSVERSPIAAIFPAAIPMSPLKVEEPVTICPPRKMMSKGMQFHCVLRAAANNTHYVASTDCRLHRDFFLVSKRSDRSRAEARSRDLEEREGHRPHVSRRSRDCRPLVQRP